MAFFNHNYDNTFNTGMREIMNHEDYDAIDQLEAHHKQTIAANNKSIDERVRATYAAQQTKSKLARWTVVIVLSLVAVSCIVWRH